jgi:DNA-binding NarL/FixJ family response regulator
MGATTTLHATAEPHHERPIRVVTVDDQAVFREAARAMIAHTAGFELVGESADGETALRLVREADPDIVILDLRMPSGPDGLETAGRISAEDPTRLLVLVSSADLQDLSEPAKASGVSALVRKNWLTPRLLRGLWVAHRQR